MTTITSSAAKGLTLCCILATTANLQLAMKPIFVSAFSPSALSLPFLRTTKHVSPTTELAVSLTPPSEKRDDSQQQQQQKDEKGGLEEEELISMISSSLSSATQNEQQPEPKQKRTELWLDLRKTAIVPTPLSLSHLFSDHEVERKELEKHNHDFMLDAIDSILVSENDLDRIRKAQKNYRNDDGETNQEFMDAIVEKILSETDNGSIVTVETATSSNSNEVGKIMSIKENDVVLDPIFAMDAVTSGKWILVDAPSNTNDEKERTESITSLVEFIGGIISSSPSSPFLHLADDDDDDGNDKTNRKEDVNAGGIALACTNKKDIFQAGVSIQSLLCQSAVEMTESGILLPHLMERDEAEFEEGVVDATMMNTEIKSAVVLPFDVMLWKNAMIVFVEEEEKRNGDGSDL